jgi:hypothetical protein
VSLALFSGNPVADFDAARIWWTRLLGEPSFFPHDREAVWELDENRSLYLVEDAGRAGTAISTVFVDDLDATLAEIRGRGLEPDETETYGNGVRKAIFRDPEGNEVGFGGGPADD